MLLVSFEAPHPDSESRWGREHGRSIPFAEVRRRTRGMPSALASRLGSSGSFHFVSRTKFVNALRDGKDALKVAISASSIRWPQHNLSQSFQ